MNHRHHDGSVHGRPAPARVPGGTASPTHVSANADLVASLAERRRAYAILHEKSSSGSCWTGVNPTPASQEIPVIDQVGQSG